MIIFYNTRKKNGVPIVSVDPGIENVKMGVKYYVNGILKTGSYSPLAAAPMGPLNNLPNLGGAICDWFQPLVFTTILKKIVNFKTVEMPTTINFSGMVQPLSLEQLANLPNVNYSWSYFMVHSCPKLQLKNDDIVGYRSKKYRIKSRNDYSDYGYMEYHMILDYTRSDPT